MASIHAIDPGARRALDNGSRQWIESLTSNGQERELAIAGLHKLLVGAATPVASCGRIYLKAVWRVRRRPPRKRAARLRRRSSTASRFERGPRSRRIR